MNVGREAVTSWMSVEAFQNAEVPRKCTGSREPANNDLYDKGQCGPGRSPKLTEFLAANLAKAQAQRQSRR